METINAQVTPNTTSEPGTSAAPVEREVVRQNIRLFQGLLQQDADNCQDTRTERSLKQLLAQENAKLATLDQQEGG